jgi:CubicO group peptidase (beta-lactamase class C family)
LDRLRAICHQAISEGVTPGLVVAVGSAGQTVFLDAYGRRQVEPTPHPTTRDTVFDLASLTKAAVTSLITAQAVAAGRLDLDDALETPGTAARATIRQALAHATGLPAHRPFHEQVTAPNRDRVVALAAAEPLVYEPGTRSLYSDLGFILLGDRLERTLGAPLDRLADQLFRPVGLASLCFPGTNPLVGPPVAATQRCPVRGRVLVGEVDDLNAYAMGGIAGHAGLFGTAGDLAALAHALCAAWRDSGTAGGPPLVPGAVLRAFWAPAGIPGSAWRLGWDGPAATGSLAGDLISRQAVGHVAFTGCSIWIDPEREAFVVLLTNRVHPKAQTDPRFPALRRAVNDAALEGIGYP